MSRYRAPIVTTDAVALRLGVERLEVLTAERQAEPFAGVSALPGVYVRAGETLRDAAGRALVSKAGVSLDADAFWRAVDVYDSVARDPRGHALSVVSLVILPPECEGASELGAAWRGPDRLPPLAFDHKDIIRATVGRLRQGFWSDAEVLRALVGGQITTTRNLLAIARSVLEQEFSPSNFRRRLQAAGVLEIDESAPPVAEGAGRPSAVWRWV